MGAHHDVSTSSGRKPLSAETSQPTNSHDYARELQKVADFLLSREAFAWPYDEPKVYVPLHVYDKETFLALVRGLGSGKKGKGLVGDEVTFTRAIGNSEIAVSISRDRVCRLVREAEYHCEPFFADGELEKIGGGQ